MKDLQKLIDNFSGKHYKKLLKITEPLYTHFGISYFCYQSVNYDGAWSILSNNPDWLMHSADQKFYRLDPSLVNPEFYQSGHCFPELNIDDALFKPLMEHAVRKYDLCHTLAIIEKTSIGCDYYFLSAPQKHRNVYDVYLNHISLLKNDFTAYFKHEVRDLLFNISDYAVDLKLIKNELYNARNNLLEINQHQIDAANFLADVSSRTSVNLTPREKQCLKLYRMGNTAKETARILSLSPRTVEEYLNNIKFKLGCRYKRDLLKIIETETL